MENSRPFRVLSLDGGGMRGLYTAVVLHTMMKRFSESSDSNELDIGKGFDLIVGTSTGGILASALAAGKSIQSVIDLYTQFGPEIFSNPIPKRKLPLGFWLPRNLFSPANSNHVLKRELENLFKQTTIKDVYDKRGIGLCIPAVNIATHQAWVFKTAHNSGKHRDDKYKLSDVCLATSAAPIYLPMVALANPDLQQSYTCFADGGLWANNPVLVGLTEALGLTSDRPIEIISIGTCPPPMGKVLLEKELNLGILNWQVGVKPLELSIDAQASGHNHMANFLAREITSLGKPCKILRIDATAPSAEHIEQLGLDRANPKSIQVLTQLGSHDGSIAHGKAIGPTINEYSFLKEIFCSMPMLKQN